jgi:hypothetical protein
MRFLIRGLLAVTLPLLLLLGTVSPGSAACGAYPADLSRLLAAQAAADTQCDCCSAGTRAQYLRCVVRVAKAAVHAGALRAGCATMMVSRAASLPCPLGAAGGQTTVPSPVCGICNSDADCQADEFCECPPGTCSATGGTCVARPSVCFDLFAPVCGCDGTTYANDCQRRTAGVCKQANGPCEGGQCFDTIQRQCTGQSCSAAHPCPLPSESCVPVCPPPPPAGTCFDALDEQCTGQSCSRGTPCPPNEICLAECPPPTGMCFDTITRQCTGEVCSPAQPCSLPNEFCTPRCPPPPPPSTTSTTLPGETCQTDAECDDGNPCTLDRCVKGTCEHDCLCVTPEGAFTCCPGPAALCPPPPTTSTTVPGPLTWFHTCGDPVCRGHTAHAGVPPCSAGEVAGASCSPAGATCDPGDGCNRLLVCATSDPTHGGMCPISRRAYKENIRYLGAADLRRLHDELMKFPLATYRYKGAQVCSQTHLGFVIDDIEPSEAVDAGREMVDLYGYTSMAVAALQTQARDIEALKREVADLRRQLARRSKSTR